MNRDILFGADYYPEDWPDSERAYDIAMMKKAGMNVVRIGEFAWSRMEPRPGEFDFGWLHEVIDELAANGIRCILGTPTAAPPQWFLLQYPEAAALWPDGQRAIHGGRRHCCSNNPDYLAACDRIVDAMGQEFGRDSNVIGWQLDNEMYTWHDGCVCPHCEAYFHERLREQYGTIDALNKAWNLNVFSQAYAAFEEVPMPIRGWNSPHIQQAWRQAHHQSDIEFLHRGLRILKQYTDAPIGTNMMPINGMSYEDTVAPMDVIQFDHYDTVESLPMTAFWFDYFRSFGKPFWTIETATGWQGAVHHMQPMKPEGFCRLNSWLTVALGGEANLYWIWRQHWAGHELLHGAVLYASGRPMPMFHEVQQVADEFRKAKDFLRETSIPSEVAMHFTSRSWQLFIHQPIVKDFDYYTRLSRDFYRPLTELGVRPEIIGAQKDPSGYKVIFSPMVMTLEDQGLGDRMEQWVKDGGIWVVGPMTDIRNEIGAHFMDRAMGRIERLTGAKMVAQVPDDGTYIKGGWTDGTPFATNGWQEIYTPVGEVLADVTDGYRLEGNALLQKIPCGKGAIWLLGTLPSEKDVKRLMRMVCEDAGIVLPDMSGTLAVIPRKGETREGLILAETAHAPASYTLTEPMTDILTGKTYEGKVELAPYDLLILEA